MEKTSPDQSKPSQDIRSQALEWLIKLADDSVDAQEYAAWMTWMEKDQQHRIAFDRASSIWGAIADMDQLSTLIDSDNESQKRGFKLSLSKQWLHKMFNWQPGWAISFIGFVVVVLMVGVLIDLQGYFAHHEKIYNTEIAEIREEKLPDNSTVILGAQTEIKVSYNRGERRVALLKGEVYFSVRKDLQRPFYVTASHLSVQVVGTEFEIDKGIRGVNVTVLGGKVNVSTSTKNDFSQFNPNSVENKVLHKGQQITSTRDGVLGPVKSISATGSPAAWRSGLLLYEDALLKDVIADTNRYYNGTITLSPESLGDLSITASFKTDQIEEILHSLDEVLPIDIIRKQNGHILLVAQGSE